MRIKTKSAGTWSGALGIPDDHGMFKGSHNTGLPDGWVPAQRIVGGTLDVANTVYEDIDFVSENVTVSASNVTLRRCKIRALSTSGTPTGVVVEDSLLLKIGLSNITARRCEVRSIFDDLVRAGSEGFIEDSWLHSPKYKYGSHLDIWQTLGMTNGRLVRCRLDFNETDGANACMQFSSGINNLLVENNYFNGGGYILSGVPSGTNIVFQGNVWGPTRLYSTVYPGLKTGTGVTWGAGNVDEANGGAV